MLGLASGHFLPDDMIGRRLVQIAFAFLIDHHAARQRAFDCAQTSAIFARNIKDRCCPGRVHIHRFGAHRSSGADAVASVARNAAGINGIFIQRRAGIAHFLVLVETAGGEHHALARADPHFFACVPDDRSGDLALFADQIDQRTVEPDGNIALVECKAQPTKQGIA